MNTSRPPAAILRQVSSGGIASVEFYPLPYAGDVKIGRDPACQIVLDTRVYTGVSRQHVCIAAYGAPAKGAESAWRLEDLNSSNGTYVNGDKLEAPHWLREGDRISLGRQGPQFIFELLSPEDLAGHLPVPARGYDSESFPSAAPDSAPQSPSSSVTFSQLFPIISTGHDLPRKAYLGPGITTVLFVVSMFIAVGNPGFFNGILAVYISGFAYYFVYQLCGKQKPWWILLGTMASTVLLLVSPLLPAFIIVFREILPGEIPTDPTQVSVWRLLMQMFFGAGLMEELLKALPVLLIAWLSLLLPPLRRSLGVTEPLDGILLGTASAVGFTLVETLSQYVPGIASEVRFQAHQGSIETGLLGLQILIPRILGSVSGHMAYSGYLGYFIGLSVLKPTHRWQTLMIGYFSAALLHALWNTTGFINPAVLALVGALSYAFLTAAILKARAISPTREQNFATSILRRKGRS
ncbi:MAG: PrsW family glutamic-type intramembrane protease [Elainellaceae cyanobacterium]